jgi:hypothetical protein
MLPASAPGPRSVLSLVYRIEETLGRAFAEVAPYSLYPVAEYFN